MSRTRDQSEVSRQAATKLHEFQGDGIPRVLPSRSFRRQHRTHVLLFNILPAIATLIAVAISFWYPPKLSHLYLAFAGWFVTGLGVTVGYHRLFTHRSFATSGSVHWMLAVAGSMAGQGPASAWVAIHRRHHERSDVDGDPHSPALTSGNWRFLRGLWHAHVGWLSTHDVPNPLVYAPDVLRDRALIFCSRFYVPLVLAGVFLPAAVFGISSVSFHEFLLVALWAGGVRLFVTSHLIFTINSICHAIGVQPYDTGDNSRNNVWLSLPTLGESWHNNHHADPTSARFGFRWWQLDVGYVFIFFLRICGLARTVNQHRVSKRL
ncbi:acyl-CoA desaturase [Stieleria varia]|uniref:Fatty acid desaturase n=1 Tax=Stieleria varia TaxID=2528005 RepID=A0A5C5ZWL7_9BACT|nr:fatty acid desaturase [Stieleria varia]TWT91994.1 Fatty acid desaturase [Stieleria varia]